MGHEIREECGVFGIAGHPGAHRLTHYGLFALQHRGQESAGIAVSDGKTLRCHKGMGLVSEAFADGVPAELSGDSAIGHVRYSTTGASLLVNAQPLIIRYKKGLLALAHNGNLVNAGDIRAGLEDEGSIFQTTSDTEVIAHLVARFGRDGLVDALAESLRRVRGAYALLVMSEKLLVGARDPNGIRPLSLGILDGSYVLSSESCAFDAVGAEYLRDVEPGEMVILSGDGLESLQAVPRGDKALCIFEYIYFARPDSNLEGVNVHAVRKDLGRRLAVDHPVEADVVTGVPDSSISAATGYAEQAGIPYEMGLIKNRYIGRTFIQPSQEDRSVGVKLKLNAVRKVVDGKKVVLVDDSIVRGTTSRHIVRLLREAGAREVHLRISSPPYSHPCFYGIDTSASSELIAATKGIREIERLVGADSLEYLSLEAMVETVGKASRGYCVACFSGRYPVPVTADAGKYLFEREGASAP